ncbi:hypothetical protein R6Q59_019197 [Mikania micrantha]
MEAVKSCKVHERLLQLNGEVTHNWQWKRDPRNQQEIDELNACKALMMNVVFGDCNDKWIWQGSNEGVDGGGVERNRFLNLNTAFCLPIKNQSKPSLELT